MQRERKPELGSYLKALRDTLHLSLRDVEGQAGVSNAFLSQLESGKIKKPSPAVLFKLAQVYRVPYATLMERAGHPMPKANPRASRLESSLGQISHQEEQALLAYLAFLRSQAARTSRED